MMTTRERTRELTPMEKFDVLAEDIDQLRLRFEQLHLQQSMDDLLEVVELSDLAEKYGSPEKLLRKRLKDSGAEIFKVGRKWVIRKVKLLEIYEAFERTAT